MPCSNPFLILRDVAAKAGAARNELDIAEPLFIIVDGDFRCKVGADTIQEGEARHLAVDDALVKRAVKGQITLRQLAPGQGAFGYAGIEGKRDDIILTACTALDLERATGLFGKQREIGEIEAEIKVRRAARESCRWP